MIIPVALLGTLAIVILFVWTTYNSLVVLREKIREAFSSIDVQLKRRADLIPNLVETVKGYAKHEKKVFEEVTKARAGLMHAKTPGQKAQADNMLQETLKSLFAVSENYPELKANENFKQLQSDLTDTENKISYARQFYNANVLTFNSKLKVFPTNIVGGWFKFKEEEFFEAPTDRETPKVSFE